MYLGLQNSQLCYKNLYPFFHKLDKRQVALEFWEWNNEGKARNIGTRLVTARENKWMAYNAMILKHK